MLVLNLACDQDHRFEGWFGSNDDFESQQARALVGCPLCGSSAVRRLPSAPRLNISHPRGDKRAPSVPATAAPSTPATPAATSGSQQQIMQLVGQILAKTEDVGTRFAEEVRRIHYGEAEERGIRGRASRAETEALAEEGIEVLSLPLPLLSKDSLQ